MEEIVNRLKMFSQSPLIKTLTDDQLMVFVDMTKDELLQMLNYDCYKTTLNSLLFQMCMEKLNKVGNEGLTQQSFSGISESYIDGYSKNIMSIIKQKRKIKML